MTSSAYLHEIFGIRCVIKSLVKHPDKFTCQKTLTMKENINSTVEFSKINQFSSFKRNYPFGLTYKYNKNKEMHTREMDTSKNLSKQIMKT